MKLNDKIDHTFLKANGNVAIIDKLCDEAIDYTFASVCVPPYYVAHAASRLEGAQAVVCTVIGFPFGYSSTNSKLQEIKDAINDGAVELDMVVNVSAINDKQWKYVENEIKLATEIVKEHGKLIKVIFETAYLSDEEIVLLCEICANYKVDFVKTSTGFADKGAEIRIIKLMKDTLQGRAKIKASGGIRDKATAIAMVEAGADRLGASAGVVIVS